MRSLVRRCTLCRHRQCIINHQLFSINHTFNIQAMVVLVGLEAPRAARHGLRARGHSVVLLSRFARKMKGLVNQGRQEPLPFTKDEDSGRAAPSKLQLASAAVFTGLAAGAATGVATLSICAPVIGHMMARTTTPLVGGYLRQFFQRRSELRDQATAGTFLLEAPAIWEMSGGRLVLEGMLLQQAPSTCSAEHVALLHFPSAQMAKSFLEHQQLADLKKEVLDGFESMELSAKSVWRAYLTAFSYRTLVPRRFCKASAALLAQQLARGQLQGPVAVVHFVSAGTSVQLARRAAASCLRQVLQAGGRGRYFATTQVGDGDVELIVSYWHRPGQLMKYLRSAAQSDWPEDEDEILDAAVEQLLACPTL